MREWKYDDLVAIAQLERECFEQQEGWSQNMLATSLISGNFYGVLEEEDNTVVSYGGISVVGDEAELQLIATAEMYRCCGRGKAVLNALLAEAKRRGAKKMFLEVRVSNYIAMLFYLKSGFKGLYARTRYYPDDEDALVMVKEL